MPCKCISVVIRKPYKWMFPKAIDQELTDRNASCSKFKNGITPPYFGVWSWFYHHCVSYFFFVGVHHHFKNSTVLATIGIAYFTFNIHVLSKTSVFTWCIHVCCGVHMSFDNFLTYVLFWWSKMPLGCWPSHCDWWLWALIYLSSLVKYLSGYAMYTDSLKHKPQMTIPYDAIYANHRLDPCNPLGPALPIETHL